MPGRPIIRAQMKSLDEKGEDAVFNMIAGGKSVVNTMKECQVGRRAFYKWLEDTDGRHDRYMSARRLWADALAEECLEIADATVDAHDATVRKLRIDTRKWLAGNVNPDNWREKRDPLINVTLGDQHLDALRAITNGVTVDDDEGGT